MALYKHFISEQYILGIWKVTESLGGLLSLLPDRGKACIHDLNTFKSDSRKLEWLAVRVLLYTLSGESPTIQYHPSGKPYLANGTKISVSHTKGYVSVIISPVHEVGIDIEKRSERVHKIAHKFVRDDERLPDDPALHTTALLLNWSAKEVMFKCLDEEAVDFREHLFVGPYHPERAFFIGSETRTPYRREFTIHYMIDPDFVITYSVENQIEQ